MCNNLVEGNFHLEGLPAEAGRYPVIKCQYAFFDCQFLEVWFILTHFPPAVLGQRISPL